MAKESGETTTIDINKKIRETKDQLITVLNSAGMPIEILKLIVSEIYNIVSNQATQEMLAERTSNGR